MMTPSDIRQYEFKAAGRNAYKAEEVDAFLAEVLVNYEKMYRENSELIKRISLLADRLETYKKDEVDIKQAVLSAQKAADIIVRDAEESVADAKQEAEAILAAAKGEADIIKSDAEKQAVADSELLLSMARDKAEDIMNKAKEKAHGILIAANDSASDTVGAANRTITSESLHYDMLKKEVSEFRASILAQYKAHIEMISKLPELAVEEASKIEEKPEVDTETVSELVDKIVAEETEDVEETIEHEEGILEFVEVADEDVIENERAGLLDDTDMIVENVKEEKASFTEESFENYVEEKINKEEPADIPISKGFSITSTDFDFGGFDDDTEEKAEEAFSEDEGFQFKPFEDEQVAGDNTVVNNSAENDDISAFFNSIENVEPEETADDDKKTKRGFFRRRK